MNGLAGRGTLTLDNLMQRVREPFFGGFLNRGLGEIL